MLESHHRAAYKAHSSLAGHDSDRRIYYAVSRLKNDSGAFLVTSVSCTPTASKRDLEPLLRSQRCEEEIQFFTARGNSVERCPEGKGRFTDDAYVGTQQIKLNVTALAA